MNRLAVIILNIFTYWLPLSASNQLPIAPTESAYPSTRMISSSFSGSNTTHRGAIVVTHTDILFSFLALWNFWPSSILEWQLLLLSFQDGCPSTPHYIPSKLSPLTSFMYSFITTLRPGHFEADHSSFPIPNPVHIDAYLVSAHLKIYIKSLNKGGGERGKDGEWK